jgi:hypothetical protein
MSKNACPCVGSSQPCFHLLSFCSQHMEETSAGKPWKLDPGEGAFYGPKIDITVYDALKRKFQCATVQLDFQLPIRFGLQYWTEDQQPVRPVIVHRAILGSVERMYAILTEHYAQKWPLWLSPRQIMVVPISEASHAYAAEVRQQLRASLFHVELDKRDQKMQKKVCCCCCCCCCCGGSAGTLWTPSVPPLTSLPLGSTSNFAAKSAAVRR